MKRLQITNVWTYGQDFYELLSIFTSLAGKEIDPWQPELYGAMNDVQQALVQPGLSDSQLAVAGKTPR